MLTMKHLVFLMAIFFLSGVASAQSDNPYSIFGYKTYVSYELGQNELLYIRNSDPKSEIVGLAFDIERKQILFLNGKDSTVKSYTLQPNELFRWLSTDPHADKYPSLSPYCFVANMPIRAIDPDGKDIYILFATTGNQRGDAMFGAAALTRQRNIEQSSGFNPARDKVVVLQVQDMAQIKGMVEKTVGAYSSQYGSTREVGVFSHGGMQGPTGSVPTSQNANASGGYQMSTEGWSGINFNWTASGGSFTMYGCNTGNDVKPGTSQWVGSFARQLSQLSNFNGVQVAGQSTYSFPSYSPDTRETNLTRSLMPGLGFSVGDTYMVGGSKGNSSSALWFSPMASPPAAPMNVYMNGQTVGSGTQSTTSSTPILY